MNDSVARNNDEHKRPGPGRRPDSGEAAWAIEERHRPTGSSNPEPALPAELSSLLGEFPEDEAALPSRLTPDRLLRGLWSRRGIVAAVWVAVTLATLVLAFTMVQRSWEAVTTLMLRKDIEELSVGGGKPYRVPEYRLETLLDTLKLPSSLAAAAESAGVDASPRSVAAAVDVSVARNSDVLNLKVRWPDAAEAARLANSIAATFVERTLRIRVEEAQQDFDRYTDRLRDARHRVERADAEVLAFQQLHEVSDFDEETKARLIDLSRLEAEHRTVLAEVDGLVTAREELASALALQPETVTSSTLYRNPVQRRLEELRWQLKEARTRYTGSNNKVIKLESEIDALTVALKQERDDAAPERTDGPNELRQDMQLHLHELNDEIRKTEGRAAGLAQSVAEIREKLSYLSAKEKEYAALKASQDAARQLEASLAAKAEEARVAASAGEPAFHVLEPAALPGDPAPSGRKLMAAAGSIAGLALGLVLALLLEIFDPTIRDRKDLAAVLDTAVTANFRKPAHVYPHRHTSPEAQAWRRFVNDLEAEQAPAPLAIVSLSETESASIVAWNIANTLAAKGLDTVLAQAFRPEGEAADHTRVDPFQPTATGTPGLRRVVLDQTERGLAAWMTQAPRWIEALTRQSQRTVVEVETAASNETAIESTAAVGRAVVIARSGITDRRSTTEIIARLRAQGVEIIGGVVTHTPADRFDDFRPLSAIRNSLARFTKTRDAVPPEAQHA